MKAKKETLKELDQEELNAAGFKWGKPKITARSVACDIEAIGRTLFGRRTKAKETTYNRLASRLAHARVECPALFETCLGECGQPVRKAILDILNPQEALNDEEGETHA